MGKLRVGDRIEKNGDIGTVKFIGSVPSTTGEWVGVEWDDPTRGKHDGSKDGIAYFTCKNTTGGSFVRRNVLNVGISIVEAIKDRYTNCEVDEEQEMFLKGVGGKLKKIEGVGMTKVQKEFEKLNTLMQIGLRAQMISQSGPPNDLSSLIPNVVELDLSKNLISTWSEVCNIAKQLTKLKVLNLSDNLFSLDDITISAFPNLHTLVLNNCQLTWPEVMACSVMWPNICHLHLVANLIEEITIPSDCDFPDLEVLNLSENRQIKSWNEIRHLGKLSRLMTLFLNNCGLSSITVEMNEFLALKHISLSGNLFQSVDVFNEINKFPAVSRITFLKNPVLDTEEYHTMQGIIIAKISKLETYNNSRVNEQDRRSAELDYLQKYGLEWKNSGGHQDPELNKPSKEFLLNHPRFMEIVEEYGAPADHQLIKKSTAIKQNLIEVMIEAPVKPDFQPVQRRLPLSMTVGNLKLFIQKLTKIEVRKQRLVYVSKDNDSYVVDLHRDFETLHDVSIEPLDRIQVRDPYYMGSNPHRRWKPRMKAN